MWPGQQRERGCGEGGATRDRWPWELGGGGFGVAAGRELGGGEPWARRLHGFELVDRETGGSWAAGGGGEETRGVRLRQGGRVAGSVAAGSVAAGSGGGGEGTAARVGAWVQQQGYSGERALVGGGQGGVGWRRARQRW